MVEVRVQVRVHHCDAWEDLVVGLFLAFVQEVESLIVPAWLLLGGAQESEEQRSWVGPALRKGTGKPLLKEEKAFVLAGLPGVAFSWWCGQWQGW